MTKRRRDRFERSKIIIPILLAGWIPSVLTLIVSYTILRDTLEFRILNDRQTLIQLVSHLVGHDLSRTTSLVEYYQTLPDTARVLTAADSQAAQQWINSAFYSHPQIDGMFVTAADGALIASIPTAPELVGKDFGAPYWREKAAALPTGVFVSAVHPRLSDNRPITDIVGAVRGPDGTILGYVGVAVLVERIGKRLSTIEFSNRLLFEVLDQNGAALFASDFKPNPAIGSAATNGELIKEIKESETGHFERHGNLYSFSPIESTGWVAVVEQPRALAYKPVHDLLGRMTVLAAWLVGLTAVFAWLGSRFYQRQLES
ncbi:MAG: cache domain-containing protein, partial [Alphaproteobacteria bacterium]